MKLKEINEAINQNAFNVRDDLVGLSVEDIQKKQLEACIPNLEVALFNISGDLNIGTIVRSCVLFGVSKVYTFGRRKLDRRSLVGAQNYISIERHDSLVGDGLTINPKVFLDFSKRFKNVLLIELSETSKPISEIPKPPYSDPTLIVFGSEASGIDKEILDAYKDSIFHIEQYGVMRSLNVATAAGIVLHTLR